MVSHITLYDILKGPGSYNEFKRNLRTLTIMFALSAMVVAMSGLSCCHKLLLGSHMKLA